MYIHLWFRHARTLSPYACVNLHGHFSHSRLEWSSSAEKKSGGKIFKKDVCMEPRDSWTDPFLCPNRDSSSRLSLLILASRRISALRIKYSYPGSMRFSGITHQNCIDIPVRCGAELEVIVQTWLISWRSAPSNNRLHIRRSSQRKKVHRRHFLVFTLIPKRNL